MNPLRKGDRGPEVRRLQERLIAAGYRLNPDAHFGHHTDTALRAFQRKKGLTPDGIGGTNTWHALGVIDKFFMSPTQHALPASQLRISENGLKFIYTSEAQPGKSNRLHWPGGNSGVTLGPGYDMGGRKGPEIIKDLQAVGVPEATAKKAARLNSLS